MIFTINKRRYKADDARCAALSYLNDHGTEGAEKHGGELHLKVEYGKYYWTYRVERVERWDVSVCETGQPREDIDKYGWHAGEIKEDDND